MRKCPKCNYENIDTMNFCLECGTPLGNDFPAEQPTAFYPNVAPTNPSSGQDTQTVVTNFEQPPISPTVVTNQPSFTPPTGRNTFPTSNFSPTPSPPKRGGSKTFLIVAGIAGVLLLGAIGIVGIGLVALYSRPGNNDMPTPNPPPPTTTPIRTTTPNQTSTPTTQPGTGHSADYQDMWVDFNVKENNQMGMRMHVSFTTRNMKGVDSYLAIYFQKSDGTPIIGKNPSFRSKTGQVAVFSLLRPAYDVAEYKDLQLFIPYTAFSLPPGKYDLQMNVNLIYKADGLIKHLTKYDFEFEQK